MEHELLVEDRCDDAAPSDVDDDVTTDEFPAGVLILWLLNSTFCFLVGGCSVSSSPPDAVVCTRRTPLNGLETPWTDVAAVSAMWGTSCSGPSELMAWCNSFL